MEDTNNATTATTETPQGGNGGEEERLKTLQAEVEKYKTEAKTAFEARDKAKAEKKDYETKLADLNKEVETYRTKADAEAKKARDIEDQVKQELLSQLPEGDLRDVAAGLNLEDLRKYVKATTKTVQADKTKTIVAGKNGKAPNSFGQWALQNKDILT